MSRTKTNIKNICEKYKKKLDLLDINLIISAVLKKPREFVLAHPEYELTANYALPAGRQELRITNYIKRRMKGEPLAYILGHKEFYGFDFKINKNVLVPRPETEMMVEEAIKRITHNTLRVTRNMEPVTIVDVGTGSGNIIISVAKTLDNFKSEILNLKLIGSDISQKALNVARQNAKIHGVNKKIKFLKSDLLKSFLKSQILNQKSEIIITANLPYLDTGWKKLLGSAETKGLKFEPQIALYAGKDGLNAYRKLAKQIKNLKTKTTRPITVFCEIGHKQAAGMKKIFSFANKVGIKKDLAGLDRLVIVEIKYTIRKIPN